MVVAGRARSLLGKSVAQYVVAMDVAWHSFTFHLYAHAIQVSDGGDTGDGVRLSC